MLLFKLLSVQKYCVNSAIEQSRIILLYCSYIAGGICLLTITWTEPYYCTILFIHCRWDMFVNHYLKLDRGLIYLQRSRIVSLACLFSFTFILTICFLHHYSHCHWRGGLPNNISNTYELSSFPVNLLCHKHDDIFYRLNYWSPHFTFTWILLRIRKETKLIKAFAHRILFTYAAMLLESGHLSIVAWYFMFSICLRNWSLSMLSSTEASMAVPRLYIVLTRLRPARWRHCDVTSEVSQSEGETEKRNTHLVN